MTGMQRTNEPEFPSAPPVYYIQDTRYPIPPSGQDFSRVYPQVDVNQAQYQYQSQQYYAPPQYTPSYQYSQFGNGVVPMVMGQPLTYTEPAMNTYSSTYSPTPQTPYMNQYNSPQYQYQQQTTPIMINQPMQQNTTNVAFWLFICGFCMPPIWIAGAFYACLGKRHPSGRVFNALNVALAIIFIALVTVWVI